MIFLAIFSVVLDDIFSLLAPVLERIKFVSRQLLSSGFDPIILGFTMCSQTLSILCL